MELLLSCTCSHEGLMLSCGPAYMPTVNP